MVQFIQTLEKLSFSHSFTNLMLFDIKKKERILALPTLLLYGFKSTCPNIAKYWSMSAVKPKKTHNTLILWSGPLY